MKMTTGMFSSARTDYSTPADLFEQVNGVFRFGLDTCAEEWNTKVPDNYITPEMDALSVSWATLRPLGIQYFTAWMNPPYGDEVYSFTEMARMEQINGVTTVGLLAARTDSKWFHAFCSQATGILALDKRVRFLLPCVECGKETDRRRRPDLEKWAMLVEAGLILEGDPNPPKTFPVCDQCQARMISNWTKQSSNSPAIGSLIVVWGVHPYSEPDTLDPLSHLGTVLVPRESMR